jgi:penicillin-binding protein 1A
MRSDYWGQGGHNAVLVVGDFFRQAFNARLIDPAIEFPRRDESFIGQVIERFEEWLGRSKRDAPSQKPSPGSGKSPEAPLDAMERMIEQGRRWLRELERP